MKILWLITARSGSKSIKNKNIKILDNKPLLAYRIISAKHSKYNSEIWLSTDSNEYAEIGKYYGASIPFMRPKHLSDDDSSSIDVVIHAMNYAESQNYKFDLIGLLEPTSPFVKTRHLDEAIKKLTEEPQANSIVAVKESRPNTLFIQDDHKFLTTIAQNLKKIKALGRQQFSKQITPSGGFYISRWEYFKKHKTFYTNRTLGFQLDEISGLEIDENYDWMLAEFIKKNKFDE